MKLFVWDEYAPDYTNGLAFAIAEDAEQARQLIEDKQFYRSDSLAKSPQVFEVHDPTAFCCSGGQ